MSALRPKELEAALRESPPPRVIDVRSAAEFAAGSIPGAENLPWADDLAEVVAASMDPLAQVIFVCAWGHRSVVASIALRRLGFRRVGYLEGGLEAWGLSGGRTGPLPAGTGLAPRGAAPRPGGDSQQPDPG
jgi:rhodanese-related sulfurtransferase